MRLQLLYRVLMRKNFHSCVLFFLSWDAAISFVLSSAAASFLIVSCSSRDGAAFPVCSALICSQCTRCPDCPSVCFLPAPCQPAVPCLDIFLSPVCRLFSSSFPALLSAVFPTHVCCPASHVTLLPAAAHFLPPSAPFSRTLLNGRVRDAGG